MIVVAGLSPAWQQIMRFDRMRWGEVNRAREVHWCGSGKVLNVGIGLTHLLCPSLTIAPLGGIPREAIEREFEQLAVDGRWTEVAASTRVCTTLLDESTGQTTELVENAAALTANEIEDFLRVFQSEIEKAAVVVLTGSLPPGTPKTIYCDMVSMSAGAKTLLDIRGEDLMHALKQRPFLVKPNREELAATVGHALEGDEDLLRAMRTIVDGGATWVVVTHGKDAVFAASARETYRLQPPRVPVVNPIGAGDSMAAGIAWSLFEGRDVPTALKFGVAAAADNVSQLLPARLKRERVMALAEQVKIDTL